VDLEKQICLVSSWLVPSGSSAWLGKLTQAYILNQRRLNQRRIKFGVVKRFVATQLSGFSQFNSG